MKKSKKIKFGLLGCGRIAQRHAQHISEFGELVATCDIVPEKAEALAKKYNASAVFNIDDLLNIPGIDVISVCTPNGLHAQHSIKTLKTGHHVLCEKPMAINVADCRKMLRASQKAKKHLFIVKQNRFNAPVAGLKKALDENRLGKILSLQLSCFWNRGPAYYENSWRGTKDLDGGTLYNQFSHFIDLIYWLVGDVKEVAGYSDNLHHRDIIEFEDTGVVALRFKNGALGTINYTVNSFAGNMEGSIIVFGERGTVKIGGQYLNELEYQEIENYKIKDLSGPKRRKDFGPQIWSESNHDKVYKNVIDVLTKNARIAANGYDGLKTVEIVEKIYEVARSQKAQKK